MSTIPPQVMLTKDLGLAEGKRVHTEMVTQKQKQQAELAGMALGQQRQKADAITGGPTPLEAEARRGELDRLVSDIKFETDMWRQERSIRRSGEEFDQELMAKKNSFSEYLLREYDIAGRKGQQIQGQQILGAIQAQQQGQQSSDGTSVDGGTQLTVFEQQAFVDFRERLSRASRDSAYSGEQLSNQEMGAVIVAQGVIGELVAGNKIDAGAGLNYLADKEMLFDLQTFWSRLSNHIGELPYTYAQLLQRGAQIQTQVSE